jgi:hypothetical protein
LLVAPLAGNAFIHRENHPSGPHSDWLWRLVGHTGYSWKKSDFKPWEENAYKATIRVGQDETAGRQPIRFDRNYVIFEQTAPETFIADDPPLVATSPGGREPERWTDDRFASALRELTLDGSDRTLRTTAPRNQHPFVRLEERASDWRTRLFELVTSAGVKSL